MNLKRLLSSLLGAMMLVPTAFAMDPPERRADSSSLTFEQQDEEVCRRWSKVLDEIEENKNNLGKISRILVDLDKERKGMLGRGFRREIKWNEGYVRGCIFVCDAYSDLNRFLFHEISEEELGKNLERIEMRLLQLLEKPHVMKKEFVNRVGDMIDSCYDVFSKK